MGVSRSTLEIAKPVHSTDGLVVAVGHPASWVFLSRVQGHLDVEGARCIERAVRAQVAAEPRYLFFLNDWSEMTDYDGAARVLLTGVVRAILPVAMGVHVLVTSQRVAFGVRAANLVVNRITAHVKMESFLVALSDAVEQTPPVRRR